MQPDPGLELPAPSHRLRRRLLRRPHRRRRPGGRGADRRRRALVPDLRVPGRAHPGAGAARAAGRSGAAATSRCSRSCCGRCWPAAWRTGSASSATSAPPIRAARRGASPPSPPSSAWRRRGSPWSRATTSARPSSGRCCSAALGDAPGVDGVLATMVCANAYLGAEPIADALLAGAQIVVTGRVADPSLTVGPALAHHGWRRDDWDRLARATMAGHLLECGAQVSGGYYADPGYKDIPDLAHVGYPIAEIDADGHCTITKPAGSGGRIDAHTVTEQLLYEVHDPGGLPHARRRRRPERGARHRARPRSRAPRGRARPSAAGDAQGQRLQRAGLAGRRRDLLCRRARRGAGPARGRGAAAAAAIARAAARRPDRRAAASSATTPAPGSTALPRGGARDVRLRVAALHDDRAEAERLPREVTALYTCGPAGGGGVRTGLRQRLSTRSCFVPRGDVPARFAMMRGAQPMSDEHRTRAALPPRPRPHRRQGQPLEHQRHRLAPGALAAARRAGHRGAGRGAVRAPPAGEGDPPPAAEAAGDELRARRGARRRRQRRPQPRQPRQGARLPPPRPRDRRAGGAPARISPAATTTDYLSQPRPTNGDPT